jgi:hypothetical protein
MADVLFLLNHFPLHPDLNPIIKDLYYNIFPRFNGCRVHYVDDKDIKTWTNLGELLLPKIKNHQLIYGDIVVSSLIKGYYFYNVNELIHIDYRPCKMFTIITNNVPIWYWSGIVDYVFFDHTSIRTDAINNICCALVTDNLYGIYTTFIYKNNQYKIIYNPTNSFSKYQYSTNSLKWRKIYNVFFKKLNSNHYSYFIPTAELNDGYTLILKY